MTEKYDALIEQVADRLCIYWGPGDPLSISEERLVAIIDLVRADERKRIREALADTEIGGPVHRAMSMWTSSDFVYRLDNDGEPTHEAAMLHARNAVDVFLAAIGLTEGDTDHE